MGTGLAVEPVVVATDTDLHDPAHRAHRIEPGMFGHERIAQLWAREKMARAFFKMSRSCRVTSSSRFKRRIASSPATGFPLPGKAFSPVFANSLHQWCSVLSAMPRSRATWACDFPLLCAN